MRCAAGDKLKSVFQSIGWLEIFVVLLVALIVIGPERLPGVITDIRAAIFAARKAINNAKQEMSGEFGTEFEQLREPIVEVARWRAMGPKAALTHALFDDDADFLESFDPKKIMSRGTAGQAYRESLARDEGAPADRGGKMSAAKPPREDQAGQSQRPQTVETRRLGSASARGARAAGAAAAGAQQDEFSQRAAGGPGAGSRASAGEDPTLGSGFSWDDII